VTYSKLVRQKQLRKAFLLVLLSVSDYKRLDTSLYFIFTNLHAELKLQVNADHDMKSLTFAILSAHRLVTEAPPQKIVRPSTGKMC